MPTRTAPTVGGSPNWKQVSLRFIDYQGKISSDALNAQNTITDAEVETYAAAAQAGSNASLYAVHVSDVYLGNADASNADEVVWASIIDAVSTSMSNDVLNAKRLNDYLRAPINGMFLENTQTIDPTNATLAAWIAASLALTNGGAGGSGTYAVDWLRFVQNKQNNSKVPT